MFLTVFTPTYNRSRLLGVCFESLKRQTCKDFEWVVVDDGSQDDTPAQLAEFAKCELFPVRYERQENQGKHIAHNQGAMRARGELFLCLDSDDILVPNAVERIKNLWQSMEKRDCYVGILAKRGRLDTQEPICGDWDPSLVSSNIFDLINRHRFQGDTALFFRTEILKKCLFRSFFGEKFLPELNMYYDLDDFGEWYLLDEVLYLCEYLPGGLTSHYHALLRKNPNGAADTYYKALCRSDSLPARGKLALLTNIYRSFSKNKKELHFDRHRVLLSLTYPIALCMRNRFFKRVERKQRSVNSGR